MSNLPVFTKRMIFRCVCKEPRYNTFSDVLIISCVNKSKLKFENDIFQAQIQMFLNLLSHNEMTLLRMTSSQKKLQYLETALATNYINVGTTERSTRV